MNLLGYIGWVLAVICGAGWWISNRGVAGIKRDLADARNEVAKRMKK